MFLSMLLLIFLGVDSKVLAQNIPSQVSCPMCMGGTAMMPCIKCGGTGATMQYGFGGFPMRMMCNACHGAGRFCSYCGGQGTIRNPVAGYSVKPLLEGGIRCAQCYGTGYWICSMCLGMTPQVYNCSFCNSGVGVCPICAGSGTFFGTNSYGGNTGGSISGGGGMNSGRSSSHNSRSSSSNICLKMSATDNAHCNGTGVCSKCNGNRRYYDSTFGTRHLVDPCVTCNGSGKCPSCHGSGKRY